MKCEAQAAVESAKAKAIATEIAIALFGKHFIQRVDEIAAIIEKRLEVAKS